MLALLSFLVLLLMADSLVDFQHLEFVSPFQGIENAETFSAREISYALHGTIVLSLLFI